MADDPHEARRILLDFITAIEAHGPWCENPDCTCDMDAAVALNALDSLELQHLDELAPK